MSDYENYDNLAFEPKISTEDLCKYLKEKYKNIPHLSVDDEVKTCEAIIIDNKEGDDLYDDIQFDIPAGIITLNGVIIATGVTSERMKTIIDALWG